MLGLYGEKDKSVPVESVRELETQLKNLGKPAEIHIYKDADHAFFNEQRPEVYHEKAATDAWRRTIGFFRENLK